MNLSDPSTRIALAALLHDLGKLAERARIEVNREQLEIWKQLDCPPLELPKDSFITGE